MTVGCNALWTSASPERLKVPLAMLLVFGSAKLLDEVFERLRQPGILGQIIAGVLLGPSVLGWVSRDDLFSVLTELGLMFLLFQAGLRVKRSELIRSSGTASLVAVSGVVVPFFAGWALVSTWGYTRFGEMSSRTYDAVVFLVIATSIAAPPLLKISYMEIHAARNECVPVA